MFPRECENYLPEFLYNTAGSGYLTGQTFCLVDFVNLKSAGKQSWKIVPSQVCGVSCDSMFAIVHLNLKMSPDMARPNCARLEGEYAGIVFTNNKLATTFLNIKIDY